MNFEKYFLHPKIEGITIMQNGNCCFLLDKAKI